MRVNEHYTNELRERFGYSAVWLPTTSIRPGDVGRMIGHQFERLTSLDELGVPFECRAGESVGTLDYSSASGVEISGGSKASVAPASGGLAQADGLIKVRFAGEGAVVFRAEDCTSISIDPQQTLEAEILRRFAAGDWPTDHVVVTEVIRSGRTTILISGGRDASVELGGAADTPMALTSATMKVINSRNISTQIVAAGDLTPLFRAKGVRKRLLRGPEIVTRGGPGAPTAEPESPIYLGEVDYFHFS